jgi:hypothetical protein
MHADQCSAGLKLRHRIVKVPDQCGELVRHCPAYRVRYVHRCRTLRNHRLAHPYQKIWLSAGPVLRRELHVRDILASSTHTFGRQTDDLVLCLL